MIRRRLWVLVGLATLALAQRVLAAPAEEEVKARHKALIAAYNKRDTKALRTFYAPDYRYEEGGGHKIPANEYLKGFEMMFKSLPKPGKDTATLSQIVITGNSATAVESRMVQGFSGKVTGPARTAQTWKKANGAWKLALEKEMKE